MEQPGMIAHYPDALARCMRQWYGAPNFQKLLRICCEQVQAQEDLFIDLLNRISIATCFGALQDVVGRLVGQGREGLTDEPYRDLLYAAVARNVSKGTPEEMISLFKRLMKCSLVRYEEAYPATVLLQANDAAPVVSLAVVRQVLEAVKPAGVRLDLSYTATGEFGFDDDPTASGFGDINDPTVGGSFATTF